MHETYCEKTQIYSSIRRVFNIGNATGGARHTEHAPPCDVGAQRGEVQFNMYAMSGKATTLAVSNVCFHTRIATLTRFGVTFAASHLKVSPISLPSLRSNMLGDQVNDILKI